VKYTIYLRTIIQLKAISAIGLDLIRGTKTLSLVKTVGFPGDKYLFAGVIDGRNIWANDLAASFSILKDLETIVGKGMCMHTILPCLRCFCSEKFHMLS
jgi:hypothetical protein